MATGGHSGRGGSGGYGRTSTEDEKSKKTFAEKLRLFGGVRQQTDDTTGSSTGETSGADSGFGNQNTEQESSVRPKPRHNKRPAPPPPRRTTLPSGVTINSPEVVDLIRDRWKGVDQPKNLWQFRPRTKSNDSEDIETPLAELRYRLKKEIDNERQQHSRQSLSNRSNRNFLSIQQTFMNQSPNDVLSDRHYSSQGRWFPRRRPVPGSGVTDTPQHIFGSQRDNQFIPNPPDPYWRKVRQRSGIRDQQWRELFPNREHRRARRTYQTSQYEVRDQQLSRIKHLMSKRRDSIRRGLPRTKDMYMTNPQLPPSGYSLPPRLPIIPESSSESQYMPYSSQTNYPISYPSRRDSNTVYGNTSANINISDMEKYWNQNQEMDPDSEWEDD